MSDGEALLAAVLENPDDDTPRLVYADFCEEHRWATRAKFIRLQVEADRHPEAKPGCWDDPECECRRCELLWEAAALHNHVDHGLWGWGGYFCAWPDVICKWGRGWIESVTMPAESWVMGVSDFALSLHPIQIVTLTTGLRFVDAGRGLQSLGDGKRYVRRKPKRNEAIDAFMLRLLSAQWPRVRTWNVLSPPRNLIGRGRNSDTEMPDRIRRVLSGRR